MTVCQNGIALHGCFLAVCRRTRLSLAMHLTRLLGWPAALCQSLNAEFCCTEISRHLRAVYSQLTKHYFLPAPATAIETVRPPWEGFLSHTEEPIPEGAPEKSLLPAWEASLSGLPKICSCLLEPPRSRVGKAEQPLGKHDKNTEIVGKLLAVVWFFLCVCVSIGFC